MQLDGLIHDLPQTAKLFLTAFVIVLSIGYVTGLMFVTQTDSHTPVGMEQNYLGNEAVESPEVMKFEKGEREMLTILHTHILSLSFIFFFMGVLVAITSIPKRLKAVIMVEPFVSIVLTFGGIFLLWKGQTWVKYIVMLSGIAMTLCYFAGVFVVLKGIWTSPKK
ncbi:MAG: hypothetical protein ABJM06_04715 [Gilvibacter sp.]